jgi:hypothetical protein
VTLVHSSSSKGAGAVFLISDSTILGGIETVLHAIIDISKCAHWIGMNTDQILHIFCKLAYVYVIYQGWV